ncbi:Uncharacterised protein [Vibrio cholerae]|nr:Uncharacterised protein [Vibrio cholerae]CSI48153.1 Uncharacterised protein [Vibrio cholerae]
MRNNAPTQSRKTDRSRSEFHREVATKMAEPTSSPTPELGQINAYNNARGPFHGYE